MILFILLLFHALIGYGGPRVFQKHIHPIVYDVLFVVEILVLTGCIIFGLTDAHWLGYTLLYGAIVFSWFSLFDLTIRTHKVYDLKFAETVLITHKQIQSLGVRGIICEGWRKFYVYVISDDAFKAAKEEKPLKVRFESIEKDGSIFMTYVVPEKFGSDCCE